MNSLRIDRVAVLGAGVMGAQIAAHCANAGLPVLLFDLAAPGDNPNAIAERALAALAKLEPAPFAADDGRGLVEAANYETHLGRLRECDLVIEAIAEKAELKQALYARIAPHLAPGATLATNTSGLAIAGLAAALPAALQPRFCGVHFFNPPRYMRLVELVAGPQTEAQLLDALETWLTTYLGKDVVRAKDTPNFIANRIGVFAMLSAMRHAERLGLGFDAVDALTGPLIGRPKSATFRTADVVGLDTLLHVVATLRETLPDDPWQAYFAAPAWLETLVAKGALGQKTKGGIYRKQGKTIEVLDLAAQDYRPSAGAVADEVAAILAQRDPAARFAALRASVHPQAQFLWAIFRDLFHYCAVQLGGIADNARAVDLALRRGFGWSLGPFETWQAAGWKPVAAALAEDIAAGLTPAVPLPAWVSALDGVHAPQGSYSAAAAAWQPRSSLPVYRRQLLPETLVGEATADSRSAGETLWHNGGLRLWRLPAVDAGIAVLSVTTKMHTLGREVIEGIPAAIAFAERECDGVVFWHEAPFAVGANLKEIVAAVEAGQFDVLEQQVAAFQRASLALKHARVPVVAAVGGMALGGGCEFLMHCTRRVAALESYIGLVEAGVGLIPAGGGCKEFAVRAAAAAQRTANRQPFDFIQALFTTIAMAKVSGSALQAVEMGFLDAGDSVVMNAQELLYVAICQARALAESGWRAPRPARDIVVAGRTGIATLEMMLVNMRAGGMISDHDYAVARAAAVALCGGEVDAGTRVDEDWLLAVERREFMQLLRTPATQQRIAHMMATGKPLRN